MSVMVGSRTSIAHVLAERGERQPQSMAYTYLADGEHESRTITFGELHRRAAAIARELASRSLFEERALLLYPSELDFICAFLGCLYAGVIAVPCPYPRRPRNWPRVVAIARNCQPAIILTNTEGFSQVSSRVEAADWSASREVVVLESPVERGRPDGPRERLPRIAFLQYTSGSTSEPRGVIVTHDALMHNEAMIQAAFEQRADDIIASWLPLYHDMGLIGSVLQPLYVGSHCILLPAAVFLQRPVRWLQVISQYRVTTSGGPDFAYDLCARRIGEEDLANLDLSTWRVAFNGAEPVRPKTIDDFARRFASVGFDRRAFQPCYGLAEATLLVSTGRRGGGAVAERFERSALESGHAVHAGEDTRASAELVACGVPWKQQRLRIADPVTGASAAPGQIGEIQVTGESVADGYWNAPEQTAATFLAQADGVWLRTGDLGFLSAGELFITGRCKDLIIVRGRNLYPQDLEETAAAAHEALQPGSGTAFGVDTPDGEAVVLVQELRRKNTRVGEDVLAAVRDAIAREHEVQLWDLILLEPGKLPRTSSGKVRRSFCKSQYMAGLWRHLSAAGTVEEPGPVPATGSLPDNIIKALSSILGAEPARICADRSLAAQGLDSLRAIELAQRIEAEWGVPIAAADLLDGMTVRELGQRVSTATVHGVAQERSAASLELTAGQKTLLMLDALAPAASPNNLYGACFVEEAVEAEALFQAARGVLERHSALRCVLAGGAESTLIERSEAVVDCASWDLRSLDDAGLRQAVTTEGARPFDLAQGPLLRLRVGPCRGDRQVLLIALHHLAGDLRSLEVILNELGELYAQETGEAPRVALPAPVPYSEFAADQSAWLAADAAQQAWLFWKEELTDLPVLSLPYDRPRPPVPGFRGDIVRSRLEASLTQAACTVAHGASSTWYVFLLSAFQTLLHRYSGATDIVVGSPFLGRSKARYSNTVGYFTNPLPLRVRLQNDPTFRELLSTNSSLVRNVLRHSDLPGALLARELGRSSEVGAPLFRAYFAFEQAGPGHLNLPAVAIGVPGVSLCVGPLRLTSMELGHGTSQFDLLLYAAEHHGGTELALNYDTDLFERHTAEQLMAGLVRLICAAVECPHARLSELELLSPEQRNEQLHLWNRTPPPEVMHGCLHERFEVHARNQPGAIAVIDGLCELTYGELLERSRSLSVALRARGIGTESRVPLLLHPGAGQIVAILGVLQTGAAYVPLDVQHPLERLAYVVQDALGGLGSAVLVAEQATLSMAEMIGGACGMQLEIMDVEQRAPSHDSYPAAATAQNIAYIIYTSGSTGKPKGVLNTHANVLRLFAATAGQFQFSAADAWTMFHSYAFDFSVWEIWGALLHGGRLVIVPLEKRRSPQKLYQLLRSESVTVLCQTPSAFRNLIGIDEPWGSPHRVVLRTVIFGGEALEPSSVAPWLRAYEGTPPQLVNMYGITETTVHVTYHLLQQATLGKERRSLIGRPISDLQVYLLDRHLRLLPAGAVGEIFVGGAGLARGYHRRPGLTAERFLPNPFSTAAGDRLYRSGDLARYLPGGELEYLGRTDHQVKIRGHRIELGEIQYALNAHPQITQALVLADADRDGDSRLIAYICGPICATDPSLPLREFLTNSLPAYMIPAAFVPVDGFVLTANGKVDRAALPRPGLQHSAEGAGSLTATQAALGLIWSEILGVPAPARDDDFFALGGHSLLVMKAIKRIREVFGVELPVAEAFASPGLAKMAAEIDSLVGLPRLPAIVAGAQRDEFPLSFAQERLWLQEQIRPGTSLFNIPIALELKGDLDARLLGRSFQASVDRHEILRTAFVETSTGPIQRVLDRLEVTLEETTVGSEPELVFVTELEAQRPFDLRAPPLLRLRLVHRPDGPAVLLLTVHHIVFDLWSAGILFEEVLRTYATLVRGGTDTLAPLAVQYGDFARWERSTAVLERMAGQAATWQRELAGADFDFTVPLDRPRPAIPSMRGNVQRRRLPDDLRASLDASRLQHGVTAYVLLLTAFKVLLRRLSDSNEILLGTDVAVRETDAIQPLIGMFVNHIPLRTRIDPRMTFSEAVGQVRETTLRAWANRNVPAQHIGRAPLFRVLFDLQDYRLASPPESPLQVRRVDTSWTSAKYDVSLFMEEESGNLTATLEYNTDVLLGHSARTLLRQYVRLLEQVVRDPDLPLGQYALLEEQAEQGLAAAFNENLQAQEEA